MYGWKLSSFWLYSLHFSLYLLPRNKWLVFLRTSTPTANITLIKDFRLWSGLQRNVPSKSFRLGMNWERGLERLLLTPLGYDTNASSNRLPITNYYLGTNASKGTIGKINYELWYMTEAKRKRHKRSSTYDHYHLRWFWTKLSKWQL